MVQWLGVGAFTAGAYESTRFIPGSIPCQELGSCKPHGVAKKKKRMGKHEGKRGAE